MVDWMNQADTGYDALRREIAELRLEVRADIAELRQETQSEASRLREEMRVGFANVDAKFAAAETAAAQRHADFMKWTLRFWVISLATLVGSIVAFSRTLR
jgi:hypothetical protein